eukprot:COSAG06_NODE_22382_length_725_cov_1.083067_3_plen_38_part_01
MQLLLQASPVGLLSHGERLLGSIVATYQSLTAPDRCRA